MPAGSYYIYILTGRPTGYIMFGGGKGKMLQMTRDQARIQDLLQGGGVNDGREQRAPSAPAPKGGLGLINIRLRYIASIKYSERFFKFFFLL